MGRGVGGKVNARGHGRGLTRASLHDQLRSRRISSNTGSAKSALEEVRETKGLGLHDLHPGRGLSKGRQENRRRMHFRKLSKKRKAEIAARRAKRKLGLNREQTRELKRQLEQ